MIVGVNRCLLHLFEYLDKRLLSVYPIPQGKGIGIKADLVFQIRMVTARNGRPDDDVLLAGIAMEEYLHQGQQDHEHAGVMLSCKRIQSCRKPLVQAEKEAFAHVSL